jgi:hypothetical protein
MYSLPRMCKSLPEECAVGKQKRRNKKLPSHKTFPVCGWDFYIFWGFCVVFSLAKLIENTLEYGMMELG